jgi:hypothetical protein
MNHLTKVNTRNPIDWKCYEARDSSKYGERNPRLVCPQPVFHTFSCLGWKRCVRRFVRDADCRSGEPWPTAAPFMLLIVPRSVF